MKAVRRQLVDFLVYLALPLVSIFTPIRWSTALLARASNFQWVLAPEAEAAWQGANGFIDAGEEKAWKSRWKQVEMLDARDMYMLSFGRARSVLDEVQCDQPLEVVRDTVLIGMHWGPSISILKLLQVNGLIPALPYRKPEKQILRSRPFYYLFVLLAARHIVNTLGPRAVRIGGAGRALRGMMDEPGSVIVVMDAPPREGREMLRSEVLGRSAVFDTGFPKIITEKEKSYVFYALNLEPGGLVRKKLDLEGPYQSNDPQEFIDNYAAFLDKHLAADPAQWRIWHVAEQFWH